MNSYFGLPEGQRFSADIVNEGRVLVLMLSVSIVGGLSFMIKDFYRSIKYANLYAVIYDGYSRRALSSDEFQRLVTFEIYTGRFNYTWTYWFLIQPILSSILGIIAFAIARSGLGLFNGGMTSEITIQSLYLYAVITFLAGFSSHKFIKWLDGIASKLFDPDSIQKFMGQRELLKATTAREVQTVRNDIPADTGESSITKHSSPDSDMVTDSFGDTGNTTDETSLSSDEKSDTISKKNSKKTKSVF